MNNSESQHITVQVSGPQKKGGHRMYSLVGSDKNGQFNTVKRFSDFDQLRNILVAKWPGCYIPSLPQKKLIGNQDSVLLEMRKKAFNSFMNILKKLQIVWYSEETQLFLHKIGETEKEMQKMKQTTLIQILEKYKINFPSIVSKQVTDNMRDKLIKFSLELKKLKQPLQSLDKKIDQVYTSNKKYNQKFMIMIETIFPEYEKNCLEVYKNERQFQQMIFTGPKKQKIVAFYERFNTASNSILEIVREIKRQNEEIGCFQDLLKVKQQYNSQRLKVISKIKDLQIETAKIHGGKESLISKIKNKTKEEQLKDNQTQIQKAQQQEKNIALLCNIITILLAETQVGKFKKQRVTAYYALLKSLFQLEKQSAKLKKQFWTFIMKQNPLQKEELDNFFQTDKSPSKPSLTQSPNKQQNSQQEKQFQAQELVEQNDQDEKQGQQQNFNEVDIQKVEQISNDEESQQQKDEEKQTKQVIQE